ncbi:MAG: hypothetical protein HY562_10025 [Ignavibacteriales bacterium]|nr:hypothetical protein [Ignavibacteriales bacterium]
MAIIQAGFVRATEDIDLLIDSSQENQKKIREALMILPDQAIREVQPEDLDKYLVVKVADEIVVDLMKKACGIDFDHASKKIDWITLENVKIPFANAELLWELKQTKREKDNLDLEFLKERLGKRGMKI